MKWKEKKKQKQDGFRRGDSFYSALRFLNYADRRKTISSQCAANTSLAERRRGFPLRDDILDSGPEPWRVRRESNSSVVFAHQAPISGLARRTRDICCSCEHRCHFEFCARVARVPRSLTESLGRLLKRLLRPQMRKSQGNRWESRNLFSFAGQLSRLGWATGIWVSRWSGGGAVEEPRSDNRQCFELLGDWGKEKFRALASVQERQNLKGARGRRIARYNSADDRSSLGTSGAWKDALRTRAETRSVLDLAFSPTDT